MRREAGSEAGEVVAVRAGGSQGYLQSEDDGFLGRTRSRIEGDCHSNATATKGYVSVLSAGAFTLRTEVERNGGGKDRFSAHSELGREAKGLRSHPAVASGILYTWGEFTPIPKSERK